MNIHGWGRYPVIDATVTAPSSLQEAKEILSNNQSPYIPRGLARSYGDSALSARVIDTRVLNQVINFNTETGILHCQAGASLAEIIQIIVPHGWFLSVTPGTRFVTVGGAIASDVHGKNHHLDGCFSQHLLQLELLLPDGRLLICSASENSDLFHATCGGMGLTGLIATATLQLKRIASNRIDQITCKARNLEEVLNLFEEHRQTTYSVAWIDCLSKGANLGRSLLMLGEHSQDGELTVPRSFALKMPFDLPGWALNHYTVKAFNSVYYHSALRRKAAQRVHYQPFFYPLDVVEDWNRMYGKNGFLQYQFVIPKAAGLEGISRILRKIADSGRGSFLAVIKVFGAANANLLSFPCEGYTLALDFKRESGLFPLLDELDAMVLDYGGRLYLAKDARMSIATFRASYPAWEQFQAIRAQYGALGKISSLQSQRLGLD